MKNLFFKKTATLILTTLILTAAFGLAVATRSLVPTASAYVALQKKADAQAVNLDVSIAALTGKRVMYALADDEGGLILEATGQGRKVPAIITYNYRTSRDENGRLVSPLFILRPGFAGGPFTKDEAPADSSRSPGCWDTIQPGDLH